MYPSILVLVLVYNFSLLLKPIPFLVECTSFENSPAETNKTHLDNLKKEKLNFQLLKFYMFLERLLKRKLQHI